MFKKQITAVAHEVASSLSDTELATLAIADAHPQLLEPAQAIALVLKARKTSTSAASLLRSIIGADVLTRVISEELNYPFVDMNDPKTRLTVPSKMLSELDVNLLARATALPLQDPEGDIVVAFANPRAQHDTVVYLRSTIPQGFATAIGLADQITSRLLSEGASTLSSHSQTSSTPEGESQEVDDESLNLVEWVDTMLARAHAERASDVSLRFDQSGNAGKVVLVLRWRIDGAWRRQPIPTTVSGREREVIGTLLARCETTKASDFRSPQDGSFSFTVVGGRKVDARLGMVPQSNGPGITLRLLDPQSVQKSLEEMGFAKEPLRIMRKASEAPQGMVFMVGPTGSGKTTTLYGMLFEIDKDARNVLTAEDPVEYRMDGLGQTQIRSGLGEEKSLTFGKALRSFMRMAPDVILIGEVRDKETAEVAVHAALTGHLMLSTIHANDVFGIFQRLDEMDVSAGAAADALLVAVNQRLARRAHSCATFRQPDEDEIAFMTRHQLAVPELVVSPNPTGCAGCYHTGYLGRLPVVEILEPSLELREAIARKDSMIKVRQIAKDSGGWLRILDDAHTHVVDRAIPVSELIRVSSVAGM